jgi:zeaxanthin glucosyltransferase
MTTLLVAPDFYSHYRPVGVLGRSLATAGEQVIVATGPTMRPYVEADGLAWVELALGPGSNDGVAAANRHDRHDADALDQFLAATRAGLIATLDHQAAKRRRELLWEPVATGQRLLRLLDRLDPDRVVVDQVSLTSTLTLVASGRPFITFVPGHPSQLPVGDEHYGDALAWPTAFRPDPAALAHLHATCRSVTRDVTDAFNQALATLAPTVPPVDDAFAVHGDLVAYRWETELHDPTRRPLLPTARVETGPLVDHEPLPPDVAAMLHGPGTSRPIVYVALGTFLCHRADVLAVIAQGLRRAGVRAAIAIGPHHPHVLGPTPDDWIVAPRLPQVALLAHADLAITHAGNGSVQEALTHGVRQLLLPFSTDQPATAADLERVGLARAADPNTLTASHVTDLVTAALAEPRPAPVQQPDVTAALGDPACGTPIAPAAPDTTHHEPATAGTHRMRFRTPSSRPPERPGPEPPSGAGRA